MRHYEFYNFTTGEVTRASFQRLRQALNYGQQIEANTMVWLRSNGWTGQHWWNVQTGEHRRRVVHPINWKKEPASPFLCTAGSPS